MVVSAWNGSGENSNLMDGKERVCGEVRSYCYMYICSCNQLCLVHVDDIIQVVAHR